MFQLDQESEDYKNLQDILASTAEDWEIDPNTLLDYMTQIGYHETGPNQRLDPKAVQKLQGGGEGKGRGLFQYETGREGGGHSALNRLIDYYEPGGIDNMPSFLKDLLYKNPNTGEYAEMGTKGSGDYYYHGDSGFDASQLTPEQQYMLFLGDKRGDKTASFKGVDTPEELKQFWVDEHWGGTPQDLDGDGKIDKSEQSAFDTTLKEREASWDDSSKSYQRNKMGLYQDTLLDQIIPQQKEKDAQKEVEEASSNRPSEAPLFDFFNKPSNNR